MNAATYAWKAVNFMLGLDGGFAWKMRYPAVLLHRFTGLSFEEAFLCETTAVSVYAVRLAETRPSDWAINCQP